MKRIFTIMMAMLLVSGISASAQVKWGLTGGLNFNTSKLKEIQVKAKTGWSAGGTCLIDLPLGFSLQPSLVYHQKGADFNGEVSQNMGYLELPVSVQWGPDLLIFRPFLDATPYVGYALSYKSSDSAVDWKDLNRFEYGIGIGGGINVWKLQFVARYNWTFGSLYGFEWSDVVPEIKDMSVANDNFGGVSLSMAFLF